VDAEVTRAADNIPAAVPHGPPAVSAKQAGEVRARWAWTEPTVWNDRMLTTLETGVKGGKWFSLIDKVSSEENWYWAFVQVAQNKGAAGVDRVTIDDFTRRQSQHLKRLTKTLTGGDYGFRPGRGCKDALRRVDRLLKDGYTYVVDADLKSHSLRHWRRKLYAAGLA